MKKYLGRFVLPLLLLAGCLAAWVAADRLGNPPLPTAEAGSTPALTTPLVSVRRVPEFATSSLRQEIIDASRAALPADPAGLSCAVVLVDGVSIIEVRPDLALSPAYAQLLITGHAAIDVLGPGFRYQTRAMARALPDLNGRIFDGLYLVGGGDPVLMSSGYPLGLRPVLSTRTPIEELADLVASTGVLRVDGGIVGVDRRYDSERSLPGWPESYISDGLVGPLSALQLDDGIDVRPAANGGIAIAASEPATHAATRFGRLLESVDIEVFGDFRTVTDDEELPELVPIGRLSSPPLSEIVFQMLAANDAGAAELILKELGLTADAGTTQSGGRIVQQVLTGQGVDVGVPFRDGSGIDPLGATTCRQLAQTMDGIGDEHPTLPILPAYNLPAVFDGRLRSVEIESDLRLIGGVVGDASGLVARTVDSGPRVTVASIVNRRGGPTETDLLYQQALVEMVDDVRVSISVEGVEVPQ